jgi:hypothetical protein
LFFAGQIKDYKPCKTVCLSQTEFIVSDTAKYESLKLYVYNNTDSDLVINKLNTSCSCVLATIQRNIATKTLPGYIYVSVSSFKIKKGDLYSIDLVTNKPYKLRLEIMK